MQASFTDLVGTAVVPTHCFDTAELTDLTPALDTATAIHDMAEQASEAGTRLQTAGTVAMTLCVELAIDGPAADETMAQASEVRASYWGGNCS